MSRGWIYFLAVGTLFLAISSVTSAVERIRETPINAYHQRSAWYEEALHAIGLGWLAVALILDNRRSRVNTSPQRSRRGKTPWRDRRELRSGLYVFAVVGFLAVPAAAIHAVQIIRQPPPAPAFMWLPKLTFAEAFKWNELGGVLIGVCLILYDRRRLRREDREATGHCMHCGYDLRATTRRRPECGNPALPRSAGTAFW